MNTIHAGNAQVWSVVVAAGSGSRFGALKQFLKLGADRVIDRAVATAARNSDGVVVVLPAGSDLGYVDVDGTKVVTVAGGDSRSESVRNGLARLPSECSVVLVHDGARPLATDGLYQGVIKAVLDGADAVVPSVAVVDSIRHREHGAVDRDELVAVQTPQGFAAERLRQAHENGGEASDDATLVESVGGRVVTIEGERTNVKITTPLDLEVAELLIAREELS